MARLSNARKTHMTRWVIPAATRLLIEIACKNAPTQLLENVAHIEMGQSPSGDSCNEQGEGVPLIGGPADLGLVFPKTSRWTSVPTKLCRLGDIIVCVRATIGEPRWADNIYCLGRGVAAIRPRDKSLDASFLFRIIEGNEQSLREQGTGTTFKTIGKQHLSAILVPTILLEQQKAISSFLHWLEESSNGRPDFSHAPPLPQSLDEQRRIISLIEELAAKIETASALRRKVTLEATALIESKLAATFESLSNKYGLRPLNDLLREAGYGTSRKCDSARITNALPVLRIPNVASEHINFDNLKYAVLEESVLKRVEARPGDILVVRTNGSADLVGRCAVVPDLSEPTAFASYLVRLRCDSEQVSPDYVRLVLKHLRTNGKLIDFARTTAGQYNVSLGRLGSAQLPVPPLDEQRQVVSDADTFQSKVGAVQQKQTETAEELDALMPSILSKAFRGEL
jgi:type I restriction enzyme S subunit